LTNDNIINENNIVELFEKWEKQCAHTGDFNDDDDGLIESLMDECEGDQKEQIAGRIINLLEKRAKMYNLDVNDLVQAARTAAGGSRHWYTAGFRTRDDDAIQDAVNALYNKVKEASDKHIKDTDAKTEADKAEAKKKAEAQKAEDKKKAQEQKEATTKEKLGDLATVLKEKYFKNSTDIPELSSAIKVITDENGNFERYEIEVGSGDIKKTFKAKDADGLITQLEVATFDPKEILMKKSITA